jgi:MSHA pilin protein MshC
MMAVKSLRHVYRFYRPCMVVKSAHGFTLIELILVLVLLGVLAVFAGPKVLNIGDLNARGFHDQTLGLLRFAQKAAIAQRRTVCVAFTQTSLTLTVASAAAISTCNTALAGPAGAATVTARAGIQYTATPAGFSYDGLGQPSAAQSFQVATVSRTITVEAQTGYAHD